MPAALITGAARRIGRAMALALAEEGHDIALHYAGSADAAAETAREVRERGVRAELLQADLLDQIAVETLIDRATAALEQPLTVLVNNASIFEHDNIETMSAESWERHVASNLRAPMFLTQGFAAQCPKGLLDDNGEPIASGLVVNMLDQRVHKLTPEFMTYTIAKMGLWAFTRTAAQALGPDIRVNGIGPGPTMQGERQSREHFANQRAATILGRGSDPGEITRALLFFLHTPGVTGQLICADGGQHLAWRTPDVLGVE